MRQQTTFPDYSSWVTAVRKVLENPSASASDLYPLAWEITQFIKPFQRDQDIDRIRHLLDVLRLLRVSKGAGRRAFEETSMEALCMIVRNAAGAVVDADITNIPPWETPASLPPDLQPQLAIVVELGKFAIECVEFVRPRDSLAANRRQYAFEMLGEASKAFDMPEAVMNSVSKLLKSKKRGPAMLGALEFVDLYYKARQGHIPHDMEELLLRFVNRTDSRGLAVGALNVLVESGNISEFTALDQIDAWKERNYR